MVNENTVSAELWSRLRQGKDQLYYVSPEMALGDTFSTLWKDKSFCDRVQAVIVDEAHCIVEWGDDFRKEYAGLAHLRNYIGQEIPIVACTATCSTETFNSLWSSLSFGYRPFWGLDAGCDRKNLLFLLRVLENTKNPILDILNALPSEINSDSLPAVLPKCLFYFETLAECTNAVETLRKILPSHLRGLVQSFVSITSEAGKALLWDQFISGLIRILCATDAVGMGCNIPDVEIVAMFCTPRNISVLAQRWERGGRNRSIEATCLVFVQQWALRPKGIPQKTKGGKNKALETKSHTSQRDKLEKPLENLINLGFDGNNPGKPMQWMVAVQSLFYFRLHPCIYESTFSS